MLFDLPFPVTLFTLLDAAATPVHTLIISCFTLTIMEIVLGIDNVIFISILSNRIPKEQRKRARILGLSLALVVRIALLSAITYVTALEGTQIFVVPYFDHAVTVKDLVLLLGGLFLLYKSTTEIHETMEGGEDDERETKMLSLGAAVFQIILIDIVFSLDSILTAVGLSRDIPVMVIAVIIAMGFMLLSSERISNFINAHPSIKMLAMTFLMMIGVLLVLEGIHVKGLEHVDALKNYIYFSMGFALFVELLNMYRNKKHREKMEKRRAEKEAQSKEASSH